MKVLPPKRFLWRTPLRETVFKNGNSWGKHADELAEEFGCTTGSNSDLTSWKINSSNKPSRGGCRWNIRHGSWKKRYDFPLFLFLLPYLFWINFTNCYMQQLVMFLRQEHWQPRWPLKRHLVFREGTNVIVNEGIAWCCWTSPLKQKQQQL